jgi:hypothetical protein
MEGRQIRPMGAEAKRDRAAQAAAGLALQDFINRTHCTAEGV